MALLGESSLFSAPSGHSLSGPEAWFSSVGQEEDVSHSNRNDDRTVCVKFKIFYSLLNWEYLKKILEKRTFYQFRSEIRIQAGYSVGFISGQNDHHHGEIQKLLH